MSFECFNTFLKEAGLLAVRGQGGTQSMQFTQVDAACVFVRCKQLVANEMTTDHHKLLTFVDFLEALARIAFMQHMKRRGSVFTSAADSVLVISHETEHTNSENDAAAVELESDQSELHTEGSQFETQSKEEFWQRLGSLMQNTARTLKNGGFVTGLGTVRAHALASLAAKNFAVSTLPAAENLDAPGTLQHDPAMVSDGIAAAATDDNKVQSVSQLCSQGIAIHTAASAHSLRTQTASKDVSLCSSSPSLEMQPGSPLEPPELSAIAKLLAGNPNLSTSWEPQARIVRRLRFDASSNLAKVMSEKIKAMAISREKNKAKGVA